MKIKYLRFKNLNSLVGEWEINFSIPEYQNEGIFAITGKTGAGKSTILDAICLALYGETPRLGKITKSINEIMSRRTGDCFSEVVFESGSGEYRCHFSQHRARKQPDGDLQNPKHEIADAVSGEILESKIRDVQNAVTHKIGMDFDQFTRSILLAQGGFAKFLSATSDERAPILEQITGTDIYSTISIRVHERNKDELNKLAILQTESNSIQLLSDEDKATLKTELINKEAEDKKLKEQRDNILNSIQWITSINTLETEIESIQKEQGKLLTDLSNFETDRIKLNHALQAAELESEYATLKEKRSQLKLETTSLNELKKNLPKLKELVSKIKTENMTTQESLNTAKDNLKNELKILKKVRELDQLLVTKKSALTALEEEVQTIKIKLSDNEDKKKNAEKNINQFNAEIEQVKKYTQQNVFDENLSKDISGIENLVTQYDLLSKAIEKLNSDINVLGSKADTLKNNYADQEKICNSFKEDQIKLKKQIEDTKSTLAKLLNGKLLREYRTEYTNLLKEKDYINRIVSLEEERKKLSDDTPCPLCGSKEHPYAVGNIPELTETEIKLQKLETLINEIEGIEQKQKQQEEELSGIAQKISPAEKKLSEIVTRKAEIKTSIAHLKKEQTEKQSESDAVSQKLSEKVKSYQITNITPETITNLIPDLRERVSKWDENQRKQSEIDTKRTAIKSDLKSLADVFLTLMESFQGKEQLLKSSQEEYQILVNQRKELYADKNPDNEEQRLELIVSKVESLLSTKQQEFDKEKQRLTETNSKISTLDESIAQHSNELATLSNSFVLSLKDNGFENEAVFTSYLLPKEIRLKLTQRSKELDDKKIDIESRLNDRSSKLKIENEKKLTDTSLSDLQGNVATLDNNLSEIVQSIGSIKTRFSEDELARLRHKEKLKLIDVQKKECEKWSSLHELIGSADGKKFRNYAQGLTFEIMVSHANKQLLNMTDRYILVRDENQPLDLNVIDNYQAGEIRSTKNLSGGESFIISLALALGLSHMASKNVKVDSLFLDEGFGTLDEDSLNISLDTIAALHEQGKLIGVISHIPAMKERILTQIQVHLKSGGVSILSGPGIRKV